MFYDTSFFQCTEETLKPNNNNNNMIIKVTAVTRIATIIYSLSFLYQVLLKYLHSYLINSRKMAIALLTVEEINKESNFCKVTKLILK